MPIRPFGGLGQPACAGLQHRPSSAGRQAYPSGHEPGDRQLLADALWAGRAIVPNGFQHPQFGDLYDADRPGFGYDPEKAKALLAEASYNGEEIVYSTRAAYFTNATPAAQAILEMWKAVGINARLNVVESTDDLADDIYMVRTWSNSTRYPDPAGAIWNLWGLLGGFQKSQKEWPPSSSTPWAPSSTSPPT
ncbi:ABC transporter substrate-binding protein [Devosia psychrophila]|uniref:Extracellular solute-binding protein, family 5 Middle n=1 Tax=Devosia psychrophila TaxID=728005 RepID=A0A0F5PUS1_9HYPH|nr:ABC transporter substrate-binding protein [Devosia psychrophila]KKC32360.1 hypothetical protein WH91_14480 [Devosia psychrophila]SFD28420.1 extracellular solute-binding protein, family 5 Middle [Devosia psychrophila]